MEKKKLLECRLLKSTKEFHALVEGDGEKGREEVPSYDAFLRAEEEEGLLRVFVFSKKQINAGVKTPAYLIFASKKEHCFRTYDFGQEKWRDAMLFNLGLSENKWCAPKIYTPKIDECLIRKYFSIDYGSGANALYYFQKDVLERRRLKRDKKMTDAWDKKMEEVPKLPKDWRTWVRKSGKEHFIFYAYQKSGAKEGYCSHCERVVPIKKPRYNAYGTCCRCRKKAQYKSIKKFGRIWTNRRQVQLLQRCSSGLLLRIFETQTVYRAEFYRHPEVLYWETERVFYDNHWKSTRYYHGLFKNREYRWIQDSRTYSWNTCYMQSGKTYRRTLPMLEKGILRKSGLPEMIRRFEINPERYMRVLEEHPCLEQIVKAGLYTLAVELLHDWYGVKINQAKSLTDILQLNKGRIKRLRLNRGGKFLLTWLQREQAENVCYAKGLIAWFVEMEFEPDDFRFLPQKMSYLQIRNYLERQAKEMEETVNQVHIVWRDYLSMAKKLGMDVEDTIVYRTPKLRLRHRQLIDRMEEEELDKRAKEIEKMHPKVEGVYREILGKYQYLDREYAIVEPKGVADIVREGTALHHCVDKGQDYFERIEDQETYILFLRRSSEKDVPYYTLEVEPGGVIRQLRTKYDRQDKEISKIKEFLSRWQENVQKKMTEEDWSLVEKSRRKRDVELEKLREEKVMIWDGNQRRLLVDVLEEDLLELSEPSKAEAA